MVSAQAANFFFSAATLLSGDLDGCPALPDLGGDCVGGLASVAAVMRRSERAGDGPGLFAPVLDRQSRLVHMHPLGWDVNRLISADYFGWSTFTTTESIFLSAEDVDQAGLRSPAFRPVFSNLGLFPANPWHEYVEFVHFDEETGLAWMHMVHTGGRSEMTTPVVETANSLLAYVAAINDEAGCFLHSERDGAEVAAAEASDAAEEPRRCWAPVLTFQDKTGSPEIFLGLVEAATSHPNPPTLIVDLDGDPGSVPTKEGSTWVSTVDGMGSDECHHWRITFGGDTSSGTEATDVVVTLINLEELPPEATDDAYVADQLHLRSFAEEAMASDPVVGTSDLMPLTRDDGDIRMCMGGECPIANLFTDALRWATDADIAFVASGGLRGPGWPQGEVKMSDIFLALPFVNSPCTGVMSGVAIYRLFKYSAGIAEFQSTYTPNGDRLLQVSGMRYTYNTELKGSGRGRLISIDIWDDEQNAYLPLERLRMYKFATDSFLCKVWEPYSDLLGSDLTIKGEVPGVVDDGKIVQDLVGEYLSHVDEPYDTSIQGRLQNNTDALDPMNFIQSEEGCPPDYVWEEDILTCSPCPALEHVAFSDELIVLQAKAGDGVVSRVVLSNRELDAVVVNLRPTPDWITFRGDAAKHLESPTELLPGDSLALDFDADASTLEVGTTRTTVSVGIDILGGYPGCSINKDITFDVALRVNPGEELNHIGSFRAAGLLFMALVAIASIGFGVWIYTHRECRIVRASQPKFLGVICLGAFVMSMTNIPLSIDDEIASERGCDVACMSSPWLISTGFAITFSALFSKLWRLNKLMQSAGRFRKVTVTERDVLAPFAVVFSLNFLLMLLWTLLDPLRWVRVPIDGAEWNTYGTCRSEGNVGLIFLILIVLIDFSALALACLQAYRARNVSTEYSESKYIGVAVLSWLQVMLVGMPLIFLVSENPTASYFLKVVIIFIISMSTLIFMFVPKMIYLKKKKANGGQSVRSGFQSSIASSVSVTDHPSTLPVSAIAEIRKRASLDLSVKRSSVDLSTADVVENSSSFEGQESTLARRPSMVTFAIDSGEEKKETNAPPRDVDLEQDAEKLVEEKKDLH